MQALRHYERLSPELVLLAESHNPNVEGTLITDYLVTGARGYDWLLQIHRDAVIVDFEDMHQSLVDMKSAVDELVDYPSIIRVIILVEGDKRTPMFVVTDLGAEGPEMVTNINTLLEKKNKTMTNKHLFTLNIDASCEDPVKYVREAIESYQASFGKITGDISVKINTENRAIPQIVRDAIPDINIVDAYPAPARGQLSCFTALDDAPFTECAHPQVKNVVKYDGVAEYTGFIRQWAEDRNIIGGGSTTLDQFIKGLNEAGELWTNISKGQHEMLKDDIGDVYVCLTNAAGCFDIKLEEHIAKLEHIALHSGRILYQRRGLKRYSLQVLYTLAAVAQSIENVLDSDNERDVEFFKADFCSACADVVYVLETIALEQGWSMTDCVAEAYNDIRDRRGLMLDGTFIKEKDFTVAMVKTAIADENTKPATREYLQEWLRTKGAVEVDEPISVSEDTVKCLQGLSDQTQEHDTYMVRQEALKDAVKGMIGNIEGDEIVTTLGLFGLPNRANEVFIIDPDKLNADIAKIVGTHIGEIGSPTVNNATIGSWLERITTVEVNNSAGVLKEAVVLDRGENQYGKILEVVGRVKPSDRASELLATNHSFGIRSVTAPTAPSTPALAHVIDLVGFDLVTENPRPFGFVSIIDKVK